MAVCASVLLRNSRSSHIQRGNLSLLKDCKADTSAVFWACAGGPIVVRHKDRPRTITQRALNHR